MSFERGLMKKRDMTEAKVAGRKRHIVVDTLIIL
ncbi:hypothetical protein Sarmat_00298 [Rickettsiales endosymbiont of Paramecium tredecaurelia]|nr:hypothetical protein [Candidatus Sarmatiella mevalonica]